MLSFAALLAALGIPIIVRSSHRLGQRGEVVLDADEPDREGATTLDPKARPPFPGVGGAGHTLRRLGHSNQMS